MTGTTLRPVSSPCLSLFIAAALVCFSLTGHAAKLKATADIKGCTTPLITGNATLTEEMTEEGIKEVTIHL